MMKKIIDLDLDCTSAYQTAMVEYLYKIAVGVNMT